MKTVSNQRARKLALDESTKESAYDGESYKIMGSANNWVRLLNDTSKQKQLEIEARIRNNDAPTEGEPVEIVYSRGKFAGYIFVKKETVRILETSPKPVTNVPQRRKKAGGFWNSAGGLFFGAVIVAAVLGLLQKFVFFPLYCGKILPGFDVSVAQICVKAAYGGFSGIAAGIVTMLVFLIFIPKDRIVPFVILEATAFIIGVLAVDFLLPLVVYIGLVLKAIFPIIIMIVALVVFIVVCLKQKTGRRRW